MKKYFIPIAFSFLSFGINAQNNLGINNASPDASALVDMVSTSKGLLVPRMTSAQRTAITSPATSLLVYQTDGTTGFYYYTGSAWVTLTSNTTGWNTTGNASTTAGTNYIGTSDAIDLVGKTNATERFRITSGGNFGIATTSPTSYLQVGTNTSNTPSSIAQLGKASAGGAVNVLSLINSAAATTSNEVNISFHTAGTYSPTGQIRNILKNTTGPLCDLAFNVYDGSGINEKMRITSDGYVGIGTTTPTTELNLYNSTGASNSPKLTIGGAGTAGNTVGINISPWQGRTGGASTAIYGIDDGTFSAHLTFSTATTGSQANTLTERMRITSSGNVGIGTTSPSSKLHLYEATGTAATGSAGTLILEHANSGGSSSIMFKSDVNAGSDYGYITYSDDGSGNGSTSENSLLKIGVENDASGSTSQDDIAIMPSGSLGIGTTTPLGKVHIYEATGTEASASEGTLILQHGNSGGSSSMVFKSTVDGSDYAYIQFSDDGSGNGSASENGLLKIGVENDLYNYNVVDDIAIMPSGSLGVGTTSPQGMMHVEASGRTIAVFNRTSSDGTVVSIRQAGTEEGTISVSGTTVSYNAFTGSHYGLFEQENCLEKGMLVSLKGTNQHFNNKLQSEVIYNIEPTTKANDPAVLGAFLALQESEKAVSTANPYLIMAVGNGEMWVVDNGEPILAGDYLISSSIQGHAMKDLGEYETSYVVARAAENVIWNTETAMINGVKHKKISVLFENFVLKNNTAKIKALENKINQLELLMQSYLLQSKN